MKLTRFITCLATYFLLPAIGADTVVHDDAFTPNIILRVTEQNYTSACITHPAVLVNGSSPGPELKIKAGETTWIRVFNDMTGENLTMHWHGLAQASTPFSDGTPQVSQWPIPPLHYFDYELHPEVADAGTYFYHSHIGFQAVSATGPLIVEDQGGPPYEYDDERIFFLSETYNKSRAEIEKGLLATPLNWSGEVTTVLVNGHGISNNASVNPPSCSLDVTYVEPNKTYRFRFIGGTSLGFVTLAFQGHGDFSVIEADGSYTKPAAVNHLQVATGQRFSVLFKTKPAEVVEKDKAAGISQYFIEMKTALRPTTTTAYAVLKYRNQPTTPLDAQIRPPGPSDKPPVDLPPLDVEFLENKLQPLKPNNFPPASVVTRTIIIDVHQAVNGTTNWIQNGYSWVPEIVHTPYLVSLYQNNFSPSSLSNALSNNGFDNSTQTFPAKVGEVLDIVFQNTANAMGAVDFHPFHAHGGHYYDLGSGNGTYNATANNQRIEAAGVQPVLRDTTVLYRYTDKGEPNSKQGWRAWRLRVDAPGVWMLHCHVLQHMIMGMQTVWVFGDQAQIKPVSGADMKGLLTYGGSAFGNKSWAPVIPHYYETPQYYGGGGR